MESFFIKIAEPATLLKKDSTIGDFHKIICNIRSLTHFWLIFPFYTPWKHQKSKGFLVFSGVWNGNINQYWIKISFREIYYSFYKKYHFPNTFRSTYFFPMFTFHTPRKTSENQKFSVFRGYKKVKLRRNGLTHFSPKNLSHFSWGMPY